MSTLAFARFEVEEVVVPARADVILPFAPSVEASLPWDRASITLVKGFTADGLIAYGEADRGTSRARVDRTLNALLNRNLRSFHPATGWAEEPLRLPLPGMFPPSPLSHSTGFEQSLVETLWLDAMGKAAGLPAWSLLGGKFRKRVRVDAWANRPPANVLAQLVEQAVAAGYKGMKLKCNAKGDTLHALAEIADSVPHDFEFTVDPMCAWRSFHESSRLFGKAAGLPFAVRIEDPFPHAAPAEWHRARQGVAVPLIWHGRSLELVCFALREQLADGYNVAGQPAFRFLAAAGMLSGVSAQCWHGSSLELGIQQMARLHACAAAPACEMASDLSSSWVREQTLLVETPAVHEGTLEVPDRPGLGATLDHEAVTRFRVASWCVE
ncbi:MAG TPA: enolase C-terminal domain-like protein [Chthoniobacteraceae bacterium]|nr:enolase C-terminal domain-like protein [Chthoniobacteraceae bacterium]